MEQWRRSLVARIAAARANLAGLSPAELAKKSGAELASSGLALEFLGKNYLITADLAVLDPDGAPALEEVQAIIFDYLANADGSRPQGQWLGFRELPHGIFYAQAFQGYTGNELVRRLNKEGFKRAAERAGGKLLPLGDLAYVFQPLPLLALAVVWWEGEEGVPPRATVLFDANAAKLLPTQGLAIVGRLLCLRLIRLAEKDLSWL